MPINILMPALSPTMEKGNLAKWLKKEGDKVKSGDVIAEIETDKATMEVEAVDEGTIAKIVVAEGTADVPVNQVIAVLAGEGEDVKAAAAGAGSAAPAPKPQAAAAAPRLSRSEGRRSKARVVGGTRHAAAAEAPSAPRRRRRPRAIACSLRRSLGGWPRKPASRCRASRLGPARPHHRPRRRRREIRQGHEARRRAGRRRRPPPIAPSMSDDAGPRAVRRGQLRGRAARRHAPYHRAAADRSRCRPSRISI